MGEKVGLDWGRTAKAFFSRTAEVSVPYLVFGFYGSTVEIHKSIGAKKIEKSFGIRIGA